MSELAYMVREDCGQHGTAMVPQSAVIRGWLGDAPYLFAVADVKKLSLNDRSADVEATGFLAPLEASRNIFEITELAWLRRENKIIDRAIVVLHPFKEGDLEAVREAVVSGSIRRLFVLVWAPRDIVRTWLDGLGALNLHTGEAIAEPDPRMIEACRMMIGHAYNGLGSGRGKDAVVQLVRAFAAEGYPVEVVPWLRAYFAAGGGFRHAQSIEKLVSEMKSGTRHRVKPRYRDNIFEIIAERVNDRSVASEE